MVGSAILRTENVIPTRLRRCEPLRRVTARHDILLGAKARNKKIVDHIPRGHDQLDRLADWQMQLVDLAPSVRVLDFPHPLLAHHVDLSRVCRRAPHSKTHFTPPTEKYRQITKR